VHRRIYLKKSEAIKLGREWRKVLHWKNLPHFRMSECAHGNGPFANLTKAERIDVATVDNLLFVSVGS
jgi:hypothetical protein